MKSLLQKNILTHYNSLECNTEVGSIGKKISFPFNEHTYCVLCISSITTYHTYILYILINYQVHNGLHRS